MRFGGGEVEWWSGKDEAVAAAASGSLGKSVSQNDLEDSLQIPLRPAVVPCCE